MTLGIRGKLFLASLGLIAVSVAAIDLYLSRSLGAYLTEQIRASLVTVLSVAGRDASRERAPLDDTAAWDALADDLGARAHVRVTVIRRDGTVIGDSEVARGDLAKLESHADRPEVRDALAAGHGSAVRWSDTLHAPLMYAAVPFSRDGGAAGVIRAAVPLTEVDRVIARLRAILLVGTLVAFGVAVLMASLAAQWMSRSVRAVTAVARRMAGGDLTPPPAPAGRDELAELARALGGLAASLKDSLDRLRLERDLLQRVLADMKEGVLLLGSDGRIVIVNPALREMLLLPADLAGKTMLEAIRHAGLAGIIERTRAAGKADAGEIEIGDLKPRRLLVHTAPLSGDAGGLLAVFVDVTDLRRLETVRRDFVANVSHELRTPVASISSAAETLRGALATDPAAAAEFAAIIERNAARMARLVDDLLDLSRVEARQFALSLEPIDPAQAAAHALSLFATAAAAKGIRLAADVAPGTPPVRADRRALEQVLTNLVDNAVKYSGEGAAVTIAAVAQPGAVHLSVRDTGPGIEARHIPRLFERFYRVDTGRSRELGGTGLGLAIVKHLVEAMGGVITVESSPGRGTAFSFTLPRT